MVADAARAGDKKAKQIWIHVGRSLGFAAANIINSFNPERIVIAGGVSHAWGLFLPAMKVAVGQQAMGAAVGSVRIVRARLGLRAGILGAAMCVWKQCSKRQ